MSKPLLPKDVALSVVALGNAKRNLGKAVKMLTPYTWKCLNQYNGKALRQEILGWVDNEYLGKLPAMHRERVLDSRRTELCAATHRELIESVQEFIDHFAA